MTYKWIGVGLYMIALLVIGVLASRRMSTVRDYYAGNKRFGFRRQGLRCGASYSCCVDHWCVGLHRTADDDGK